MTIPFWCLQIGCLLPYTWLFFTAKQRKELPEGFDNQNPRTQVTKLTGAAAWAMGAHNNALEAIPVFASGVIVNHILGADPATATKLSVAFHGGDLSRANALAMQLQDRVRGADAALAREAELARALVLLTRP